MAFFKTHPNKGSIYQEFGSVTFDPADPDLNKNTIA